MWKPFVMCGGLMLVVGCGGSAKFDASTDETAKASMQKMQAGMSEKDRGAFALDCMAVAGGDIIGTAVGAAFSKEKPKVSPPKMFKSLHGMTATEIRAKAAEVRAKK